MRAMQSMVFAKQRLFSTKRPDYIHYDHVPTSFENPIFDEQHHRSIHDRDNFWHEQAQEMVWQKPYSKTIEKVSDSKYNWFPDGCINICYNVIDKHIDQGRGD